PVKGRDCGKGLIDSSFGERDALRRPHFFFVTAKKKWGKEESRYKIRTPCGAPRPAAHPQSSAKNSKPSHLQGEGHG
ncbi:MAG TPA: hypothetical protein P5077_09390, partial [bacterium]|nr:hypothetical protein [bacterium]